MEIQSRYFVMQGSNLFEQVGLSCLNKCKVRKVGKVGKV